MNAGGAIDWSCSSGIGDHRQVERVAIPVRLSLLALHRLFVSRRFLVPVVAGKARRHRHQIAKRYAVLARVQIAEWLVGGKEWHDPRIGTEHPMIGGNASKYRGKRLARRAHVVGALAVEAVKIVLENQLAVTRDK